MRPLAFALAVAAVVAAARPAAAQTSTEERHRFFVGAADDDPDATRWQGSLIASWFLRREAAGISDPLAGAAVGAENAAPTRWFTDLRAQLDASHLGGGRWDARLDGRIRLAATRGSPDDGGAPSEPLQSGRFGGDEYELRELYLVHGGSRTDVTLGRQAILDVAGMRIDGLRVDYASSARWTYLAFAGLYPQRGSRSLATDYPHAVAADGTVEAKRVLPVAAGAGAAYRTERSYGAIGVAGILPLGNDRATGTLEQPRLLVTSNGYWRASPRLDVFHYGVIDLAGAAGFAVTNLSAGADYRPSPRLRLSAGYDRVDTETLDVQAQTRLEEPDPRDLGVVQNNVAVARLASDAARVAVSAALGRTQRWEVTTGAAVRQRPALTVGVGGTAQTLPAGRSLELSLAVVDHHLYRGVRAAATVARVLALGDGARATSSFATLTAGRELGDGRGEWEASLSYAASEDRRRAACTVTDLPTCYGAARTATLGASGTGYYRLGRRWLGIATVELARQTLAVLDGAAFTDTPAILSVTAFARLAYRF